MPVFHVHASVISTGGSASDFARYLHRDQGDLATQHRRYLDREGRDKEDLIASGHANMPAWAQGDDHAFWLTADRTEKAPGVVARVIEFALPRELSPQAQLELVDDFREALLGDHSHSWAVHAPASHDGSGPQPHVHIMFSPRTNDGLDRTPERYFRTHNHVHPEKGGARKDPAWEKKGRLYDVRWAVATLANAALEREGHQLAVTHLSLRAQGLDRDPARYANPDNPREIAETQAYRDRLHQMEKPFEQELARAAWSQHKHRAGITDLSREAMVDRVRDHAFRYDRSPRRDRERQQSFERSLTRSQRPIILERAQTPRERTQTRSPAHQMGHLLERLVAARGHGRDEAVGGAGLRVKLHGDEREHEHDRGMSW